MKLCRRLSTSFVKIFDKIGRLDAKHPKKIIALSIVFTVLMSIGGIKLRVVKDMRNTITPINARSYEEKRTVDRLFPMKASKNWNLFRTTDFSPLSSIILFPKSGDSVLKKSIFEDAVALDRTIRTFEVEWEGEMYNYSDLCAKTDGECYKNPALSYADTIKDIPVRYPINIDVYSMQFNVTSLGFGGVTVGDTNEIVDAKALRLLYFLADSNEDKIKIVQKWQKEYVKKIDRHKSNQTNIIKFAMIDIDLQFNEHRVLSIKYGAVGIVFLSIVCVLSSMTSDWTTSKPLLSIAGCVSPCLAIVTSMSMTAIIDIPLTIVNFAVPFIITGIGVDDMFVLIAAWRKTDRKESVINRMGETFSHAAMSVTTTSLTNLITFLVGASLPIPVTRNFCIQGSFAIFFDWVFQITFFGACMALDGYREEKNLHPITFTPVVLAQDASEKTWIYKFLFTRKSENTGVDPPKLMVWFRDTFGSLMIDKRMQISILLILMAYLAGASWGLTQIEEGYRYEDNFAYGTDTYEYAKTYYEYFGKYNHPIQVVIDANLDYSNRTVQKQMTHIINSIQNNRYVSRIALNWLNHFLLFTRLNRRLVASYNLSDPKDFNTCLREVFFNHSMGKIYKNDVVFNKDGIHISASRFILLPIGTSEMSKEIYVSSEIRRISDYLPYSPTVFCPFWSYYEVFPIVGQILQQTIFVAIISVFVAFLIFVPVFSDVICSIFCVISIQVGILGYMAILGIQLNFATTAIFIVSIGFCIDSSAHILNSFALAEGTVQERIRQMYFTAGMPVSQGSITTLLAVTPLIFIPNYMFYVLFILVYMQIIISFLHAIFVLPTLVCFRDVMVGYLRKSESKVSPSNDINDSSRL